MIPLISLMRDVQVTHYYHLTLEHAGAVVSKFQHSNPNTLSSMVQSFCHLWLETIAEEKIKLITKRSAFTSYLTSLRLCVILLQNICFTGFL